MSIDLTHLSHRAGAAGLATAGIVAALGLSGGAAQAAPAAAAVQSCTASITSIKALDLQEDGLQDEIFVRLGDGRTTTQTYVEGQLRNTIATGSDVFVGNEPIALVEHDAGSNTVLGSRTLACATGSRVVTVASANGDAIYEVNWRVVVNP